MIYVDNEAQAHISKSLARRGSGVGIRVGVRTTGCSGLAYVLEYVDFTDISDHIYSYDGFLVCVDPKSDVYLGDLLIGYEKMGLQEGLKFTNPNEKGKCGCGESFSV